jgi:hypothetical protein
MSNNIERIAIEIIDYSSGSFSIPWTEEYNQLTYEEQLKVQELVYDEIADCFGCGWHFHNDELEHLENGEGYCWRCYQEIEEESEE